MDESQFDFGIVIICVVYLSINYKDVLVVIGVGKIIWCFFCVGGIDLLGMVIGSFDLCFKVGDLVIVISFDIGVVYYGGYVEIVCVLGDWVVLFFDGLILFEVMVFGMVGFIVVFGIVCMEENGLCFDKGLVIVIGAIGGVGSLVVDMLVKSGYYVVVLIGKESEVDYLCGFGVVEIMLCQSFDLLKICLFDCVCWVGVVDNLGGDFLVWIVSIMEQGGIIVSIGLVVSMFLNMMVVFFILCGVLLFGIDFGYICEFYCSGVWQCLVGDFWLLYLVVMVRCIFLDDLLFIFNEYIIGGVKGCVVVEIVGG